MSFVLPGNQRQLRFTGEAKALKDDNSGAGAGIALGKPRVRKPTTPPPALPRREDRPQRNTGAPASFTPASPGILGTTLPPAPAASIRAGGSYSPSVRAAANRVDPNDRSWDGDGEDQQATMAFDREGADVLPGRATRPPPPPMAVSVAPIPNFRPAHAAQAVIVPNHHEASEPRNGKGAPLALWIFAAILAGILSYYVTPTIMSHFEAPPASKAGS